MEGIREDNVVKEMVDKQMKRHLKTIAKAHSQVLDKQKERLKSFDSPESFQFLKWHERRYVLNN